MEPAQNGTGNGPIVPRDILSRSDLTATDKLVYAYVADAVRFFALTGGAFRKAAPTIAAAVSADERTVRRSLSRLDAAGLLRVEQNPGETYRVELTPDKMPDVPRAKCPTYPGQNARTPRAKCPGTPDKMPDEGTTLENYPREPLPLTWGRDEIAAEQSRIRVSWMSVRPESDNTNGRGISLGDAESITHAAKERLCVQWTTHEDLVAAMTTARDRLLSGGYPATLKAILNNIGKDWDSSKPRGNGKPPGPERLYPDMTGQGRRKSVE